MTKWTKQQQNAINARNRNILVSAAAGSGKTAVLSERVVKLITDENKPINIDSLLIVTFTNAAAAEMKSRIWSSLEKMAQTQPYNKHIRRQMTLLPSAKICTIDSFCMNVVRENFYNLDISADFEVLDESENSMLEDMAANKILDYFFEEKTDDFRNLYDLLSTPKNDDGIINVIKEVYHYIYVQPLPYTWLDKMIELYNPKTSFNDSVWYQYIKNEIMDDLDYCKQCWDNAIKALDKLDKNYQKYLETLQSDYTVIMSLTDSLNNGFDNIVRAFSNIKWARLPSIRNYSSLMKSEIMKARGIYKEILTDLKNNFLSFTEAEYAKEMQNLFPILKTLRRVLKAYDEELLNLKSERNRFSFNDIEHFAVEVLIKTDKDNNIECSEIAKKMRGSFNEILIDEYQDTNETQDLLFSILSNEKNLFMVGDVKQSIYRFRLAMPQIFIKKKDAYVDFEGDDSDSPARIILDKNFRSRKGICDYVNYVFSLFMSKKVGEIDYNKEEFLNSGAEYEETPVCSAQIKIFDGVANDKFDDSEAAYIAKTILAKVNRKELIKSGDEYRPVKFSDFAILFRSARKHIGKYAEILEDYGIPVVCDNSKNLFENSEIILLMSFLRVINNILLDIDLLTVMLSPLYSFTPDEIAEIKLENIGVFHNAVINSNSDKVKKFVEEIKMLGRLALTMSVSSFIRYLCEFKNIYAFSNALSNGEQRHANIDKFITFAENFDSSDSYGLASFIRLADKAAKDEHAPDSAELNAAGDNAVIMMSVHRSKGLEFPIVIYAGTARRNVIRDGVSPVLLNQDMGIGLKSHNEEHLYRTDTVPWTVINNKNKIASISENLRVLYVAMTRAKEQFISFITLDDLNKTVDRLEKRITTVSFGPHNSSKLLSDSDYLLTAALMHRDGEILRKYCSTSVAFFETAEFQLDTEIIDSIDDVIVIDETEIAKANMDIVHAIGEKLKFVYPGLPLANIPAMRAASNLNDNDTNLEHFFSSKPAFMDDGVLSPVQRGTAMHEFMHYCDYRNARDDLEEEIERLVKGKYITEEQAVSLNRKALVALFSSAFAKRVFESDKVYREIQLTAFESVNELEGIDFNEKVLVQGIADCVFEEDDELVLIDYKTDNVYNDEQLIDLYRNQLSFYKRALAKTMHKNVKESYLYSFCLNKAIKL